MKKKVNLFLVGAAKAGTTSLQSYLNQHDQIYFSPLKEPNYFAKDINPDSFTSAYKKRNQFVDDSYFKLTPLPDAHISFIQSLDYYEMLFKDANNCKYLGDASTSYLYSTVAANEIKNYNPNAYILILLRNPIERAYSHYNMALQAGYTDLSFKDAILQDINNPKKGFGISNLFIELGLYSEQMKRFQSAFSSEQIMVLFYNDYKSNSIQELNKIFNWLNIDEFTPNIDEQKNVSLQPKLKKWNKILSDVGIKKMASSILPDYIREKVKKSYYSTGKNSIAKVDYQYLLSIYLDDIKKTETMLNKDLSSWYKS